jgi:hypothetical protein
MDNNRLTRRELLAGGLAALISATPLAALGQQLKIPDELPPKCEKLKYGLLGADRIYEGLTSSNKIATPSRNSLDCSFLNMGLDPNDFRVTEYRGVHFAKVKVANEDKVNNLLTQYGKARGFLTGDQRADIFQIERKLVARDLEGMKIGSPSRADLEYSIQAAGLDLTDFRITESSGIYFGLVKPLSEEKIRKFVQDNPW